MGITMLLAREVDKNSGEIRVWFDRVALGAPDWRRYVDVFREIADFRITKTGKMAVTTYDHETMGRGAARLMSLKVFHHVLAEYRKDKNVQKGLEDGDLIFLFQEGIPLN